MFSICYILFMHKIMDENIKVREFETLIQKIENFDFLSNSKLLEICENEKIASMAFKKIDTLAEDLLIDFCLGILKDSKDKERLESFRQGKMMQGLDLNTSEYFDWLRVREIFSEKIVDAYAKYVESCRETDLSPVGRLEYIAQKEITRAGNIFHRAWLKKSGSELTTEERTRLGFTNKLAEIVIDPQTDEPKEVPWHIVYKNEIQKLVDSYDFLINELSLYLSKLKITNTDEIEIKTVEAKLAYYKALVEGYKNSDENYFHTVVEELFAGQNNSRLDTPIHIHHFEYGYSRDGIQRIPSGVLRLADHEHKKVNQDAQETKMKMISGAKKMLERLVLSAGFDENIRVLHDKTTFFAAHFLRNMDELVFPPTGQILPNDERARIRGGLNITLSVEALAKRLDVQKQLADNFFGPSFQEVFDKYDQANVEAHARTISSHEFSHGLGVNLTTFERVDQSLISQFAEEWKATVGGCVLDEWVTYLENSSEENYKFLEFSVVAHVMRALRYVSMRTESSSWPYLRKSIALVSLMEKHGLLKKDDGQWKIDIQKEKVLNFNQELQDQYERMIKIYDSGEEVELRELLKEIFTYGEFAKEAFEKLKVEVEGEFDVDSIIKLPDTK